jgi:hypothetical protein
MRLPDFTAEFSLGTASSDTFQVNANYPVTPGNNVVPAYHVHYHHTLWDCNEERCEPIASMSGWSGGYEW